MKEAEVWKDIPEYEGLYQVSNFGRVKSLKRKGNSKERILKPEKNNKGYLMIGLRENGKRKMFTIHRLVAMAFIPNSENLPCINHKDENKENNRVENLEWVTVKQNNNYGTRNERLRKSHKGKISPRRKPILQYTLSGEFVKEFNSATTASKELNLNRSHICNCCNGKRKSASGFLWKYKE